MKNSGKHLGSMHNSVGMFLIAMALALCIGSAAGYTKIKEKKVTEILTSTGFETIKILDRSWNSCGKIGRIRFTIEAKDWNQQATTVYICE